MRYDPAMSFGRNPHVAKAEAAEQKAAAAPDDASRDRALREAAHLWDRAAERETDARRRGQYTARAEATRARADGATEEGAVEDAPTPAPKPRDTRMLN
jgi:hypothetical protein